MSLDPGTPAPDFTLFSHKREQISLADLKGQKSMIVFVPYPFTRVCTAELCDLRDNLSSLDQAGARVVVITTHALSTNAEWVRQNGFTFDVLADYWPHGAVSLAYDAFDERFGYSTRVTYFLDADGVIRNVSESLVLGEARDHSSYPGMLEGY